MDIYFTILLLGIVVAGIIRNERAVSKWSDMVTKRQETIFQQQMKIHIAQQQIQHLVFNNKVIFLTHSDPDTRKIGERILNGNWFYEGVE